jgi:hypothetical protein
MWNQQNRYYNTKKIQMGGKFYDSKFEAVYGMEVEQKLKNKEILGFDTHLRLPLEVNGYNVCDYYIDFAIYHLDGTTEYVETKGYPTPVWKLKWKLFCALYQDDENIKITLINQMKTPWKPRLRKKK